MIIEAKLRIQIKFRWNLFPSSTCGIHLQSTFGRSTTDCSPFQRSLSDTVETFLCRCCYLGCHSLRSAGRLPKAAKRPELFEWLRNWQEIKLVLINSEVQSSERSERSIYSPRQIRRLQRESFILLGIELISIWNLHQLVKWNQRS